MALELPEKGFTKREREWLESLIEDIKTTRVIDGAHIDSEEKPGEGTLINAECGS